MTYIKRIFSLILLVFFVFTGCQSTKYSEQIDIGAEYPVEMFPIYKNATVYKYEFDEGIIDLTFGTEDSYEKVSNYYDLLFEHSKYDVTVKKMTSLGYTSAGKTNHYKYLMEVNKPEFVKEKKLYSTIVSLRITINDFAIDNSSFKATPTPQVVDRTTPAPTNTIAPTDTPEPTTVPNTFIAMEVISAIDMQDEQISVECLDVLEKEKNEEQTTISILLKIINYGDEETGFVSANDFALIDNVGKEYHSEMVDGVFGGGVNILPGGYCIDYITFAIDDEAVASILSMPDGIGSRLSSSYDLELSPLAPPLNAGIHNGDIRGVADISQIPTFIIGQEYTIDGVLTTKLSDAQYFNNHTTVNQENLMYTFNMEFTNISDTVILPAEIRDFVLYDLKHNIIVKPTQDLTPYSELALNPVQNGLSENYNISFEVFEETSENYLCLLLTSTNQQNNLIIYKIR